MPVQTITALERSSKKVNTAKKTACLRSQAAFSQLMRTRPVASWNQYLIHVQHLDIQHAPQAPKIELGFIVPKKAYALAVDRNRVRRAVRAQVTQIAEVLPHSVQILFRVKSTAKYAHQSPPQPIKQETSTKKPTKKSDKNYTPLNPHSQAFLQGLEAGLKKMVHVLTHVHTEPRLDSQPSQTTTNSAG